MNYVALDVAIGLILVYLILSLAVLAVNEAISTVLRMRARGLSTRIGLLLGGEEGAGAEKLVDALYKHPLVKALHEKSLIRELTKRPAYIPSRTFVLTLIDVLAGRQPAGHAPMSGRDITTHGALVQMIDRSEITGELKKQLQLVVADAQADLEKAKLGLETWFNNAMDRAGAAYKMRIQSIGILVGVVVAFALNADTIVITRTLANSPVVREALVAQAQQMVKGPLDVPPKDSASADSLFRSAAGRIGRLSGLGIPLGFPDPPQGVQATRRERIMFDLGIIVGNLPGLLLTALAVSLGAPFWFDLLNKVMTIRTAGRSPDEPNPAGRTAGK